MLWTSRANFRTECYLCPMMCNLLPQLLIRRTVRSAIFPRTWTKARTRRVPPLIAPTARQSPCSPLRQRRKRSDHSCRSSRKSQIKQSCWPLKRQSKRPARARRTKASLWLPMKCVNWPKAPKAVPAMCQWRSKKFYVLSVDCSAQLNLYAKVFNTCFTHLTTS